MSELAPAARTGPIALEGYARHVVTLEDFVNRRHRRVGLMVALQEEADSYGPVLSLVADLEDQCHDMWRGRERMLAGSALLRLDSEEAARLADVLGYLLVVLDPSQADLNEIEPVHGKTY